MRLYTIGHSNHSKEEFLNLISKFKIAVVADVRSAPFCRYATHFNKDLLEKSLNEVGVKYLFLGDSLGGRPQDQRYYDAKGHIEYGRLVESPRFQEGVQRLLNCIQTYKVAILCGEEDPGHCHRRFLVGRALGRLGVEVFHIRGNGRMQSEPELEAEEIFVKDKGQLRLF